MCLILVNLKSDETSEVLLKRLTDHKTKYEEKLEILNQLSENTLSREQVLNLSSHLSDCEEELIIHLSQFLLKLQGSEEFVTSSIHKTLVDRLNSNKTNSGDTLIVLDFLRSSNFDCLFNTEKQKEEFDSNLFKSLFEKQEGYENIIAFLNDPIFPYYAYISFNGDNSPYLDLLLKKIKTNPKISKEVLEFIIDSDLIPVLTEKHIDCLIELSHSETPEISSKALNILSLMTHYPSNQDWRRWREENKEFQIVKRAFEILNNKNILDKNLNEESKLIAIEQLSLRNVSIPTDQYKFIITDIRINPSVRKTMLGDYMDLASRQKNIQDELETILLDAIKDPDLRLFAISWIGDKAPFFLDKSENIQILLNYLNNDPDNLTKGFSAYSLRKSKKYKKKIALSILNSCEQDFKNKNTENRGFRLKVLGLNSLVGKEYQQNTKDLFDRNESPIDLTFWRKAVSEMPDDPPEDSEKTKEK